MPFDLYHLFPLKYAGYTDLENTLRSRFGEWLNRYVVTRDS